VMVFRTGSCVINRSSVIRSRLGGCRTAGALRSDISRIHMLFSGGTDEKHEAALHALPCDLLQPSNYRTHPRRRAVVIGVGMGVPLPCWCWLLRRGVRGRRIFYFSTRKVCRINAVAPRIRIHTS
jgi:hypothetical protein